MFVTTVTTEKTCETPILQAAINIRTKFTELINNAREHLQRLEQDLIRTIRSILFAIRNNSTPSLQFPLSSHSHVSTTSTTLSNNNTTIKLNSSLNPSTLSDDQSVNIDDVNMNNDKITSRKYYFGSVSNVNENARLSGLKRKRPVFVGERSTSRRFISFLFSLSISF
jgi:hypothetical protein